MFDLADPEIRFAVDVVKEATRLALEVRKNAAGSVLKKPDKSPVTVADFAIQGLVAYRMEQQFPDAVLVGEESSSLLTSLKSGLALKQVMDALSPFVPGVNPGCLCRWIDRGTGEPSKRYWIVDPIDGTTGFIRGDQFAIALALIEKGKVKLAVLGCPVMSLKGEFEKNGPGILAVAIRGQGSWISKLGGELQFKKMRVSGCKDLKKASVLSSVELSKENAARTKKFMDTLEIPGSSKLMDSLAKYVYLAMGHGEILFYFLPPKHPEYRWKIWDVAPGYLVVEEAGGKVTDLFGKPLDFGAGALMPHIPGLLATNGSFHALAAKTFRALVSKK